MLKDGSRRVSFKSTTGRDPAANRIVPPAPGSPGDPRLGGASLTVYNATGSGGVVTVALPGTGWSAVGASYRFRGAALGSPISSVRVQADRIQVKGGGAGWAYTLNEPSQRRVALRLALGSDLPWCAAAPAKVRGNPPSSAGSDKPGLFVAQPKTPPPLTCPPTP